MAVRRKKIRRIGILTAGGDCPGLNAVIRAVVKPALEMGIEVIGFKDGYSGLMFNKWKKLDAHDVSGILVQGGTILGTSNKDNPFRQPFKDEKTGKVYYKDLSDEVVKTYKNLKLDALICIGGDGTQTVASKLVKKGLSIVGVPKTIDNDLVGTDMTFGFDSAMTTATEAVDKLHTTAQSHHRVMVLEVMGRYAGWIALSAGLAGGGDIILIPEIPYDINSVCAKVKERNRKGKRFSIVVVAEGARPKGGSLVVREVVKDSPDPIRLGGIGNKIGKDIEQMTGLETRVTILGHIQRGGTPTPFDRILATRFGIAAMELVRNGDFGKMVCLRNGRMSSIELEKVGGKVRTVPKDCEMIKAARMIGTCLGD